MENLISRAKKDITRFENHPERKIITEFHFRNFEHALESFYHNYYRDILGSFRNRISLRELEGIKSIDSCFQNVNVDYFKKRKI
jgi:hypothetical protein